MAAPTIPNGEEHFFPIIYSGNGQGQRVGKFVPFTNNGTIAKSVMYNDGDSAYIQRTPSSETNRDTWTLSYWVKRGVTGQKVIFQHGADQNNCVNHMFDSNNRLNYQMTNSGSYTDSLITNMTFEDTSKWYHIVLAVDTTQSTEAYRVRMYVDGDEITSWSTANYPAQNVDTDMNTTTAFRIGGQVSGSLIGFDGYLAEVNFIDGQQLTPSTFGVTDTSTGRWIPKALTGITYGTNGFRLQFGTSSALGDDTSGNENDFSVTNLVAGDQRTDTPTNNLPTMRPYNPSYSQTLSEGNLQTATTAINRGYPMCSTLRPKGSGKYYAEVRFSSTGGGNTVNFGCYAQEDLHNYSSGNAYTGGSNLGSGYWYVHGGHSSQGFYHNGTKTSSDSSSFSSGDVLGLALDLDNDTLSFYNDDGNLFGSTTFDSSKSACFAAMTNASGINFIWNFGDNGTFNGNETAGGNADSDGIGNFFHSVPTGFKALTKESMPETDRGVTGLAWFKNRDDYNSPSLVDSSRGQSKNLFSSSDDPEQDYDKRGLSKFLKGGYSCGEYNYINGSGDRIVGWNWVANGGTTSTNENGSITTTTQVNSTAGFSIIQYTGTEAAATIGHGLSQTPDYFAIKSLETHSPNGYWIIWHKSFAANQLIYWNLDIAIDSSTTMFNNTLPTSSVIHLGANFNTNMSGDKMICYAWHEVDGYSKFGTYTGNNSTDGPFIYTGFLPAYVLIKRVNGADDWYILDNAREPNNPKSLYLEANTTNPEATAGAKDFLSNGFKIRDTNFGNLAESYIYMAFAEHPFVGDGTSPVTAR